MRILWMSNSPFCNTGYGIQTAKVCRYLKQAGHDVAIFAFYGLSGGKIEWEGIEIYPYDGQDYGEAGAKGYYDHFKADILISLVDVWVLSKMPEGMRWYPWTPVDHEPIPPLVASTLKTVRPIVKPIAMAPFGVREFIKQGIDHYYIPHSVDTNVYIPNEESRQAARKTYGWENAFVIGSVGTNVRERKNWTVQFKALQKFLKYHPETVMYCHTDPSEKRGRNLEALRQSLGLVKNTFFPSMMEMKLGIPDTTMANMYNTLDIYLQPSKGEGFGIPIIEAQSCGVPVIVTNATAMPDLVAKGGYVLKDIRPEFDEQNSWEAGTNPDEIVEHLENAWQMWKHHPDEWLEKRKAARIMACGFDDAVVFHDNWMPVLEDIEKNLHHSVEKIKGKAAKKAAKKARHALRNNGQRQPTGPAPIQN